MISNTLKDNRQITPNKLIQIDNRQITPNKINYV